MRKLFTEFSNYIYAMLVMFGTTRIDGGPYNLVNISDFNSLIAQSQKLQHSCFCSVRRTNWTIRKCFTE